MKAKKILIPMVLITLCCNGNGGIVDNGNKPKPRPTPIKARAEALVEAKLFEDKYTVKLPSQMEKTSSIDNGTANSTAEHRYESAEFAAEFSLIDEFCKAKPDFKNSHNIPTAICDDNTVHWEPEKGIVIQMEHNYDKEVVEFIADSFRIAVPE